MTKYLKNHKLAHREYSFSHFDGKPISELIDYLTEDTKHLKDPYLKIESTYDGPDEYYIYWFRPMTEAEITEANKKAAITSEKRKAAARKRLVEIAKKEVEQLKKLAAKYPNQI